MRVLLATDSPDLGHALSLFLSERRVQVVDVVDDLDGLLAQASTARPDAVLVDWRLGAVVSCQMVAGLMRCDDPTPVIVLSTTQERSSARTAGAAAYATLGDHPDSLLVALDEVARKAEPGATRASG